MRRLASALAQHVARVLPFMMPAHQRAWAEAMQKEIDEASDNGGGLRYALGCLWATGCTGALRVSFLAFAIRACLAASTAGLAVVAAVTCGRMLLTFHASPMPGMRQALLALGGAGLAYAFAADRLVRRGPSSLGALIAVVLIVCAGVFRATCGFSESRFIHALSLETLGFWSCVALGAVSATALSHVARSEEKRMGLGS